MLRAAFLSLTIAGAASASLLMNSTVAVGGFDAAVRVGSGTGTVFKSTLDGNILTLCIVTADHVLRDQSPDAIGIRGSMNGGFDVNATSSSQKRKGPAGTEDLGFVSVTVDLGAVTQAQAKVLAGISPVPLAPAPDKTPFDIMAFGYGATARPTNRFEKIDFMGAIYVNPIGDPAFGYGVERSYKSSINLLDTFNKEGYKYAQMSYSFADNGDGFGLGGDSGSGLIANGKIVGVYATAQTMFFTDAAMPCNPKLEQCAFEAIYSGSRGSGVALSADDVNWLNDAHTPEPAAWLLFGTGLAILIIRRLECG